MSSSSSYPYDSAIDLSGGGGGHPTASRSTSTTSSSTSETLASELDSLSISQTTRLDFAKKLGYTEGQVELALLKLGPSPSQNELLSELISLDGGSGSTCEEEQIGAELLEEKEEKRHIIVDGSNVAMSHGSNTHFSTPGLLSVYNYFTSLSHTVTIFIPSFRREDPSVSDPSILLQLEQAGALVWTPSRVNSTDNKKTICYDDRYILKLAVDTEGVVVSNDVYRDLVGESPEFRKVVEERLLMFSFVGGRFTPPEDPLGRSGPSLAQFLLKSRSRSAPPCPYARKCTYGSKCKYYHPFTAKSISDTLRLKQAASKTRSVPLAANTKFNLLSRTKSASASPGPGPGAGPVRPHKKLTRQLSINPYENSGAGYLPPFPNNPALSQVWSPIEPEHAEPPSPPSPPAPHKLRYHLSQIFPVQQVNHVLELYPDCADASFICTEIVRIFK